MNATMDADMKSGMKIVLVAAVAENGVIGANGGMPWRLKSDLAHFRALTIGKPVIMGRKTFESIGKPLKDRTNIVITRATSRARRSGSGSSTNRVRSAGRRRASRSGSSKLSPRAAA